MFKSLHTGAKLLILCGLFAFSLGVGDRYLGALHVYPAVLPEADQRGASSLSQRGSFRDYGSPDEGMPTTHILLKVASCSYI
jgi:hypothetical protein